MVHTYTYMRFRAALLVIENAPVSSGCCDFAIQRPTHFSNVDSERELWAHDSTY